MTARFPADTRTVVLVALLVLWLAGAAGCQPGSDEEDRMPRGSPTGQAVASEALAFGGIEVPSSARVVGVEEDAGIDRMYRLVVDVPPGDVERLLTDSKFTTPLQPGRKVFMPPLAGYEPNEGTDIASAQDRLPPGGERKQAVFREVLVDRGDPDRARLHIWLFTT